MTDPSHRETPETRLSPAEKQAREPSWPSQGTGESLVPPPDPEGRQQSAQDAVALAVERMSRRPYDGPAESRDQWSAAMTVAAVVGAGWLPPVRRQSCAWPEPPPLPGWMPTPEERFNMARHAEFHSCACGQEIARLLRAVRWLLEERENR